MPEIDDKEKEKEFLAILDVFERFIDSLDGGEEDWEILEELMALRADFAIRHAIKGFGMDWETALDIIKTEPVNLSEEDQARRSIIVAAIDNLIDFSVAEEYQMAEEVREEESSDYSEEEKEEMCLALCKKYNLTYASVENMDIEYSMMIAAWLVVVKEDTSLMYMTQGDERVRPWHLQFEGFTAPKSRFPEWLIPPIEHQCRCYLVEVDASSARLVDIQNKVEEIPEMPDWYNKTFKESVALGGRIFSDEHPYFEVAVKDTVALREIAERIKGKYFNG